MSTLLTCDVYVFGDIIKLLSYDEIMLLHALCKNMNSMIEKIIYQSTKVRGCWSCVQDFTHKYPNVREISLSCCNDTPERDGTYCFPDIIEKIYVDDQTDESISMPLPKQLKVFHTGGLFLDKIECPTLEEFVCSSGGSPPPYFFDDLPNLKIFVGDECTDEKLAKEIYKSPLEVLSYMKVRDSTIKKMNTIKLKYLECNRLDGSCFEKLKALEHLIFLPKKEFDAKQFSYLCNLKSLEIRIPDSYSHTPRRNITEVLKYAPISLEYLTVDYVFITRLKKQQRIVLAEFIASHFINLKYIRIYHDENKKIIKFLRHLIELNPKISTSLIPHNFLNDIIKNPHGFLSICIHNL